MAEIFFQVGASVDIRVFGGTPAAFDIGSYCGTHYQEDALVKDWYDRRSTWLRQSEAERCQS
jgi:hypothetical protein